MPAPNETIELLKVLLAWPTVAIAALILIICNVRKIGSAFRRTPIIRKLTVYGIEIDLDVGEANELKRVTDEALKRLIEERDLELRRYAQICGLNGSLEAAALEVLGSRPQSSKDQGDDDKPAKFRATLHIMDPVFVDQLYQITEYCYQRRKDQVWFGMGSAGRRFSIRYGIIGLAWRSRESQAVDRAFHGKDEEAKEDLIRQWSMSPEQAANAAQKPSCLAIAIKESGTSELLGILYADAECPDFFGKEKDCEEFAKACESLKAVTNLRDKLGELRKLAVQISVGFDLVKIGQQK